MKEITETDRQLSTNGLHLKLVRLVISSPSARLRANSARNLSPLPFRRRTESLRQQQLQVFPGQIMQQAIVRADDCVGKIALGALQLEDFFFHGLTRDQPVSKDLTRLANAVRAIDGLRFDRRVPPRVEQVNIFRGVQVETETARLQADQKQLHRRIVLKLLHPRLTIARASVEVNVRNLAPIQPR